MTVEYVYKQKAVEEGRRLHKAMFVGATVKMIHEVIESEAPEVR